MESMESIGQRLREERERRGLSQTEMAAIASNKGVAGTTRQSQSRYEQGKQQPGVLYLAALGDAGFDVWYVMTGVRSGVQADSQGKVEAVQYTSTPLVSVVTTDGEKVAHAAQSHDELAWRDVLIIAVDELRAAGLSLPGEKLAEVVDLLVEFQKHGLATTRDAIRKQIRLVA